MKLFVALLAVGLPALAAAHSWIVCTDYLENNGWYWDKAKCRAWPRNAKKYNLRNRRFGLAGGFPGFVHRLDDHPELTPLCNDPRDDAASYQLPMAAYYLGQKVVITHPTKNHASDPRCGIRNRRDTENLMYVVDGDEDPCCIDSPKLIQIMDMGVSPSGRGESDEVLGTYPKPGFQNAPKFCEDPDKAMGTNNFTIPMDLKPGRHTFVWKWIRSPRVSPFTTCWEADVFATKVERDAHYAATGRTTEDMWDFYQIHNIVDGEIVDPIDPVDPIITG